MASTGYRRPYTRGMADNTPPQIQIDDDWKAQAQAEKAKLAEQEKARLAEQADSARPKTTTPEPGAAPREELPPADFLGLVSTLASQAMMLMGMMPDPMSGQRLLSLDTARRQIDTLAMLQDKTQGNLTDQESNEFATVLYEMRSRYVQVSEATRPVHR